MTTPAPDLDELDWRLLAEVQADARASFNELARRTGVSAPTVAERIRRLERRGVLTGYRAVVDPGAAGAPVEAFVELRCALGSCLLRTTEADEFSEIVAVHKLGGRLCSMLRVRATSLAHLEGVVEAVGRHGQTDVHIVLSTQYDDPTVRPPGTASRPVTPSAGWSRSAHRA